MATNREGVNGREYSRAGIRLPHQRQESSQTQVNLDGGSLVDQVSDAKDDRAPSLESIQEVSILTNNFQARRHARGDRDQHRHEVRNERVPRALFDYCGRSAERRLVERHYVQPRSPVIGFNYFGGNLGGPIVKNSCSSSQHETSSEDVPEQPCRARAIGARASRRFFFADSQRRRHPAYDFLSRDAVSGRPVPIPNNIIRRSWINPLGRAVMNAFRWPNNPSDRTTNFVQQYDGATPVSRHIGVDWK